MLLEFVTAMDTGVEVRVQVFWSLGGETRGVDL